MHSPTNKNHEGVTVIVWLPTSASKTSLFSNSGASIVNSELSFGHAALRTYGGGKNGKGDYLSFYSGRSDCGCGYDNCDRAHFHKIQDDEENCYKDFVEKGIFKRLEVHLDIVNVEAVNQKIQEIKRAKGRIWGFQQNCSDLVLEALRVGVPDFSSHIYQRPYGWKTSAFFMLTSMPSLFILRLLLREWFAAEIHNQFFQRFFSVLKTPEWNDHFFSTVINFLVAPTLFEWLLLSAQTTIRFSKKINPIFHETDINWLIKNSPIKFLIELPEREKKETERLIHRLAFDFIKDEKVQQFFTNLVISIEVRNEKLKGIIPPGTLINAYMSWFWSALYFLLTFGKHQIPFRYKFNLIMQDSGKIALGSFLFQLGWCGMGKNWQIFHKLDIMIQKLMLSISAKSPISIKTAYDLTLTRFPNLPLMSIRAAIIGVPLIFSAFAVKKLHDTMVTPSYVFKLANDLNNEQEKNPNDIYKSLPKTEPSSESIFSFFNKKTLLITSAVLASSALLFYDFDKFRLTTNPPKLALT